MRQHAPRVADGALEAWALSRGSTIPAGSRPGEYSLSSSTRTFAAQAYRTCVPSIGTSSSSGRRTSPWLHDSTAQRSSALRAQVARRSSVRPWILRQGQRVRRRGGQAPGAPTEIHPRAPERGRSGHVGSTPNLGAEPPAAAATRARPAGWRSRAGPGRRGGWDSAVSVAVGQSAAKTFADVREGPAPGAVGRENRKFTSGAAPRITLPATPPATATAESPRVLAASISTRRGR